MSMSPSHDGGEDSPISSSDTSESLDVNLSSKQRKEDELRARIAIIREAAETHEMKAATILGYAMECYKEVNDLEQELHDLVWEESDIQDVSRFLPAGTIVSMS